MRESARGGRRIGALAVVAVGLAFSAGARDAQEPKPVAGTGVENLHRLSERLYSGGQPLGTDGFATLAKLGIRTIVSVDGMAPDLVRARAIGMRYVHIPVGYDGIDGERAARLIKALRTLPGPVFIHCHHGKHRGPTAAALGALATEGWDVDQALKWLERAGTSPRYPGLFATVRSFRVPGPEVLAAVPDDLPEVVPAPPLVEAMVRIDARWENLGLIRASNFGRPTNHPDLSPSHEATLLAEHYRELGRGEEARRLGADFLQRLRVASENAQALAGQLQKLEGPGDRDAARAKAATLFQQARHDCDACHARRRNP